MLNNQIIVIDRSLFPALPRGIHRELDAERLLDREWNQLCALNVNSTKAKLIQCGFCWAEHGEVQWMQTFTNHKGNRVIRHQPGESQDHPYQSVETPRHKAYNERAYLLGDREGLDPEKEAKAEDGKTIADTLLKGVVKLAYEHQHSQFKAGYGLTERIQRAAKVDRVAMFHTDQNQVFSAQQAPILRTDGDVPLEWIRDLNRPLNITGGLREIIVFTCDVRNGAWCPKGRVAGCGKTHARTELIHKVPLDEALIRGAMDEYRYILNAQVTKLPKGFWTDRKSYDRYVSALGGDGQLAPLEGAPAEKAKTRNGVRRGHSRAKAEELEAMYAQAVILPHRAVDLSILAPTPSMERPARTVLDWRAAIHWGGSLAPCRFCGQQTRLRDDNGEPAHKTCAEEALAS